MNKKIIIVVVILFVVGVIGGILFFNKPNEPVVSSGEENSTPTVIVIKTPSETLKEYTDPSGFIFSYPDDLTFNIKKITDTSVYSSGELVSKDSNGSITFVVADSKIKSFAEWKKQNVATESAVKETTLGTLAANAVTSDKGITLLAFDQGVLFSFEIIFGNEKDYWTKAYNTIISSYAFSAPAASSNTSTSVSSDAGSDDVILESEE